MGKALYERSAEARELMDKANEILGFSITDVMFGDSADDLKATRVTQPAIFIHSVVLALCSGLETPAMAAGHSLGEFSALAAAGSIVCTAARAALHQEKLKQELKQIKATTAGAESSESTAARLTATIHYITAFATSI
jgi:[acyl-carrier-protein] S-malonyltransferase